MPLAGGASPLGRQRTPLHDLFELLTGQPPWHADETCPEHPGTDRFAGRETSSPSKMMCSACLAEAARLARALEADDAVAHSGWGDVAPEEGGALRSGQPAA